MLNQEVKKRIAIWGIRLRLLDKAGYSIYATIPDKNETDVLIALDEYIILFKTYRRMGEFVVVGSPCNISTEIGYSEISSIIDLDDTYLGLFDEYSFYDFNQIAKTFANRNWSEWKIKTCANVLNHLNMVWDMAKTLDNHEIKRYFMPGTYMRDFMNNLTLIQKNSLITLEDFDKSKLSSIYNNSLALLANRILLIC